MLVLLPLLFTNLVADLADEALFRPTPIVECLKSPNAAGLDVLTDTNPFYLRGDFDADGKPDYALQVRRTKVGIGLLVCLGNGSVILLGSGIGVEKFSDKERDAFLAPFWAVYTKEQASGLAAYPNNVPRPVPKVKGESIAMIWEDGISLIYWDGTRFKWAGSKE
jgi:hypothetical protein